MYKGFASRHLAIEVVAARLCLSLVFPMSAKRNGLFCAMGVGATYSGYGSHQFYGFSDRGHAHEMKFRALRGIGTGRWQTELQPRASCGDVS